MHGEQNLKKKIVDLFIISSGAIPQYCCENVRHRTSTSEFEIVTYWELPVDKTLFTNFFEIGCQILYSIRVPGKK